MKYITGQCKKALSARFHIPQHTDTQGTTEHGHLGFSWLSATEICGILGISNSQSPDGVMFHLLFSNTLTGGGYGLFLWSQACARSHSISVGFLRVLLFPLEDKTCCSDMLCFGIFFNFFGNI